MKTGYIKIKLLGVNKTTQPSQTGFKVMLLDIYFNKIKMQKLWILYLLLLLIKNISCLCVLIAYFLFLSHYFIDCTILGHCLVSTVHFQLHFSFFFRGIHIFCRHSLVICKTWSAKETQTTRFPPPCFRVSMRFLQVRESFEIFAQPGVWPCRHTAVLTEWMRQKPSHALNIFSLYFISKMIMEIFYEFKSTVTVFQSIQISCKIFVTSNVTLFIKFIRFKYIKHFRVLSWC